MFEYKLNYFYVFSNSLSFDQVGGPGDKDYKIVGFNIKQEPMVISLMVNDLGFKWCHQFKSKKTAIYQTHENGNFDMDIELDFLKDRCDYISLLGGLESDFDL